jgi:hypothetical protein
LDLLQAQSKCPLSPQHLRTFYFYFGSDDGTLCCLLGLILLFLAA